MAWRKKNSSGGESPSRGSIVSINEEDKQVPKGHVPMVAGNGDGERVLVPVSLLKRPHRKNQVVAMAARQYGFAQPGVLRVPCDAGHFRRVVHGAMHRCGGIVTSASA
ncbi:hypothetical protein PR202_gb11595 [Eleusine coracana subsp. coracana]|uniref:Uncharacterized protein n=1 Tax=Eleusine coracana subsp. coracana TaxID=191504 RepID=A0AAV5ENC8_ELECO|nr:hypothetical protein PR202_gb11595 [Eleusine coracana subsp. coracana]